MTLNEIKQRLNEQGIRLNNYSLRRGIDTFISFPTRNQNNNRRDITQEEFQRLLIALALRSKKKKANEIKDYLDGVRNKTELMGLIIDSNKVDELLKKWIEG